MNAAATILLARVDVMREELRQITIAAAMNDQTDVIEDCVKARDIIEHLRAAVAGYDLWLRAVRRRADHVESARGVAR